MPSGVDPLGGVLDATPPVPAHGSPAAHRYPLAGLASAAGAMHAVAVGGGLHATAAIDGPIRPVGRPGELGAPGLDGIIGSLGRFSPFPVADKIISPGNYLKAHGYFQICRKVF